MHSCAVLHVTSLLGGGVDRHVRDIARVAGGKHVVWHAGRAADAVELPDEQRCFALDAARVESGRDSVAGWLRSRSVGLVHVHSLDPKAKAIASLARETLGARVIATLHDVLFLRRNAFDSAAVPEPEPEWLAGNARFLRACEAVVAPSEFIAGLARRHVEGLEVQVIPNGADPPAAPGAAATARPEFAQHRPAHVALVLGAIGPHKGSELLEALARELEGSGIAVVVVGYLDRQIVPGWRVPGTYFIHGAYADADVPALARAYGARIALFPNRAPESFSYALSDLWSAGLPVLVPPVGALAERVRAHGGGWLLPEGFDARAVASRLRELFSPQGAAELARVESQLSQPDAARVPTLASMARSLDALYDRFGLDPARPADGDAQALERLLATNLDGSLFREELARLADEYVQLEQAHAQMVGRAQRFEEESRDWIAKLERDVAALNADIEREVAARRALGEENAQLAIHKAAFDKLPEVVRKWLLKRVLDARS